MNIRLLRGQVVIREDKAARHAHLTHIVVPETFNGYNPDAAQEARTWHRGTVLAMGAPAQTPTGAEVDPGFVVGDEVIFHWAHLERGWTRPWIDGEDACWVPQAFVDAVVNERLHYNPIGDPCTACGKLALHYVEPRGRRRVICPSEVHQFGEVKT